MVQCFLERLENVKWLAVKRVQLIDATNENEEKIMQQLNHPNIVKLFHFYSDYNFK
jgi:hypothetical protein